jgi:predicted small secreted protein
MMMMKTVLILVVVLVLSGCAAGNGENIEPLPSLDSAGMYSNEREDENMDAQTSGPEDSVPERDRYFVNRVSFELPETWSLWDMGLDGVDSYNYKRCYLFLYTFATMYFTVEGNGQDLSSLSSESILDAGLNCIALREHSTILSTEQKIFLGCPALAVKTRINYDVQEDATDPPVRFQYDILIAKDDGLYNFNVQTVYEDVAAGYYEDLADMLKNAYDSPMVDAVRENDLRAKTAYSVKNATYELPNTWMLRGEDSDNRRLYYSKNNYADRLSIGFAENGQVLSGLSPEKQLELLLRNFSENEDKTIQSSEKRNYHGLDSLAIYAEYDPVPHDGTFSTEREFNIYLVRDSGIYIFSATTTADIDMLSPELEKLVENTRFD